MKRVPLFLTLSLWALACTDMTTGPAFHPDPESGAQSALSASAAMGLNAVTESVTGSGHLFRPVDGGWRTFSFHATKTGAGVVKGKFQWRLHFGKDGSQVKGDAICLSIEENQAWVAVLFEKARGEANIGKWASIWVVDHGEGVSAPPDELSIRWRGFPYDSEINPEGLRPEDFCQEHWTDQDLLPIEAGNIQIH